jgi:hypothetical protein
MMRRRRRKRRRRNELPVPSCVTYKFFWIQYWYRYRYNMPDEYQRVLFWTPLSKTSSSPPAAGLVNEGGLLFTRYFQ